MVVDLSIIVPRAGREGTTGGCCGAAVGLRQVWHRQLNLSLAMPVTSDTLNLHEGWRLNNRKSRQGNAVFDHKVIMPQVGFVPSGPAHGCHHAYPQLYMNNLAPSEKAPRKGPCGQA